MNDKVLRKKLNKIRNAQRIISETLNEIYQINSEEKNENIK